MLNMLSQSCFQLCFKNILNINIICMHRFSYSVLNIQIFQITLRNILMFSAVSVDRLCCRNEESVTGLLVDCGVAN